MQTYLDRFFEEKNLSYKSWEIQDSCGLLNMINTDVVIEFIKNDKQNAKKYERVLTNIDFQNGDVTKFLKYIAEGIINL